MPEVHNRRQEYRFLHSSQWNGNFEWLKYITFAAVLTVLLISLSVAIMPLVMTSRPTTCTRIRFA